MKVKQLIDALQKCEDKDANIVVYVGDYNGQAMRHDLHPLLPVDDFGDTVEISIISVDKAMKLERQQP